MANTLSDKEWSEDEVAATPRFPTSGASGDKDETFSADAAGLGTAAEAIGAMLDSCARVIDDIVSEARKEPTTDGEAASDGVIGAINDGVPADGDGDDGEAASARVVAEDRRLAEFLRIEAIKTRLVLEEEEEEEEEGADKDGTNGSRETQRAADAADAAEEMARRMAEEAAALSSWQWVEAPGDEDSRSEDGELSSKETKDGDAVVASDESATPGVVDATTDSLGEGSVRSPVVGSTDQSGRAVSSIWAVWILAFVVALASIASGLYLNNDKVEVEAPDSSKLAGEVGESSDAVQGGTIYDLAKEIWEESNQRQRTEEEADPSDAEYTYPDGYWARAVNAVYQRRYQVHSPRWQSLSYYQPPRVVQQEVIVGGTRYRKATVVQNAQVVRKRYLIF